MKGCLDDAVLQSYFDGELSRQQMESARSHLAACATCAAAARQLESEISLLTTALAPEFEGTVPTERLQLRIDAAVAELPLADRSSSLKGGSFGWLRSLASLFAFTPQQALGYAALAIVLAFGVVFAIVQKQIGTESSVAPSIAQHQNDDDDAEPTVGVSGTTVKPGDTPSDPGPKALDSPETGVRPAPVRVARKVKTRQPDSNEAVARVKLIPGERSYLKTIAALDSTIKGSGERPMRPGLQAEYERNLAVVDRALAATRDAAKRNPNDPDAKQFLFDAYQSKVHLLNAVADARAFNRQY